VALIEIVDSLPRLITPKIEIRKTGINKVKKTAETFLKYILIDAIDKL